MVRRSAAIFLVLLLPLAALAEPSGEHKVEVRPPREAVPIAPDGTAQIPVAVEVIPGFHIFSALREGFSTKTSFALQTPGFEIVEVREPEDPHEVPLEWAPGTSDWQFEGVALFVLVVRAPASAAAGETTLQATISYQACDARGCVSPPPLPFTIPLRVDPAAAPGPQTPSQGPAQTPPASETPVSATPAGAASAPETPADAAVEGRLDLGILHEGLVAGFITLLTPCVYPMIPVTIAYFSKQQKTGKAALLLAGTYAAGIVAIFTTVGIAVSILLPKKGVTGFGNSPYVNLFVGIVFVIFALALFGAFELKLPSGFVNRVSASKRQGYLGALFLGFVFSVSSFACSAPFAGTVLARGVVSGSWLGPTLGMISFSSAIALPFFFLAAFPGMLKSLPRSGGWMDTLKHVCAFLELGAAFKFLGAADQVLWESDFITQPVVIALWSAISLATGLYLLGIFRFHGEPASETGTAGVLAGTAFLALGVYFATGLLGARLGPWEAFLTAPEGSRALSLAPRDTGTDAALPPGLRDKHGFIAAAEGSRDANPLAYAASRARDEGKRIFVDFTGPG